MNFGEILHILIVRIMSHIDEIHSEYIGISNNGTQLPESVPLCILYNDHSCLRWLIPFHKFGLQFIEPHLHYLLNYLF